MYRAIIRDVGVILESDSFSIIYRAAMREARGYLHDADCTATALVEFEMADYSDYEYMNEYGYMQRDMLHDNHIGFLAVSRTGYTLDYKGQIYDYDREKWKSVQSGKEVIRCKDCRRGEYETDFYGNPCIRCHNSANGVCHLLHDPDWFCADGERKCD